MKLGFPATAFWLLSIVFAFAHSPYFTISQPIRLPDGTLGEMRLLHGDGIMAADLARIVLFDSAGRLLAKSHRSTGLTMLCEPDRLSCRGYDRHSREVIVFDPPRFKSDGPLLSDMGDRRDNDPIWALEADPENWGFLRKPAELSDIWIGLIDELLHPLVIFGGATVALTWLAVGSALRSTPASRGRRSRIVRALAIPLVWLAIGASLLFLLAGALLVLDSWPILLVSTTLGAILAEGLKWIGRRSKWRPG